LVARTAAARFDKEGYSLSDGRAPVIRFSSRTNWDLTPNAVKVLVNEVRARGRDIVDLTETNPTHVGLATPGLLEEMIAPHGSMSYEPEPFGMRSAREAVVRDLAQGGAACRADQMFLSASTSEAYAWIFKLLCDPGDEVFLPAPSYPLFSYLTAAESVRVAHYPLIRDEGFRIDIDQLAASLSPRARAIVVVHPNNPTGTLVHETDARALEDLALERGLAIVSDEVFRDSLWQAPKSEKRTTFAGERRALTFVLGGLSKSCCAPGLKLAFTSVHGPSDEVESALSRMEVIADTFLSVATPVQLALADILAKRPVIQAELSVRLVANLASLDRAIESVGGRGGVRRLPADGGWSAVLEVPRTNDEATWVKRLLLEDGVLVHPGYFFDFEREGFLVVSLLPDEMAFARGIQAVVARTSEG
jgi:alanine-synthesizing transaminase